MSVTIADREQDNSRRSIATAAKGHRDVLGPKAVRRARRPLLRPAAWALAAAVVLLAALPAQADNVQELVRRADNAFRSKTAAAVFVMDVKTSSFERSYDVVLWDDSRGKGRTLVKILGPALWRGFGTLKLGNQLKLFNPKTNHVSVVSHSMLGDSWMGSHFTNDDLVRETELARDYKLKLDKKWKAESPLGQTADYYRIHLTPKPTAPVAWGRIDYELFVAGDVVLPTTVNYYRKARDSKPSRTMTFSDIDKLGGRKLPTKVTVTVRDKPGEFTSLTYKKLKLDVKIPDAQFTEQSLRK